METPCPPDPARSAGQPPRGQEPEGLHIDSPNLDRLRAALVAADLSDGYAVHERLAIEREGERTFEELGLIEVEPGHWLHPSVFGIDFGPPPDP